MVYLTGDMHGDPRRLLRIIRAVTADKQRDVPAVLIICGDFGFILKDPVQDVRRLETLTETLTGENITICFPDGNHENHGYLDQLPAEAFMGGKAHRITERIFHLMRGEAYVFDGSSYFVFGGADSMDKEYRIRYEAKTGIRAWWPRELPDETEYTRAKETIRAHGGRFDYVVTHTAPRSVIAAMGFPPFEERITAFLETVSNTCGYKKWFFGHFHMDRKFGEKFRCLYQDLVKVEGGGTGRDE